MAAATGRHMEERADPGLRRGSLFRIALACVFLFALLTVGYSLVAGRSDGGVPKKILELDTSLALPPLEDEATPAPRKAEDHLETPTSPSEPTPPDAESASNEPPPGEARTGEQQPVTQPGTKTAQPPTEIDPSGALREAPDPALVSYGRDGPLPVIAPDGSRALDIYARPFTQTDSRPRVAIVIGGLGLSKATTEAAITMLPGAVTLAFSPYGRDLQDYLDAAREAGHEVVLELPMEPFDYPHNDPGKNALLTGAPVNENLANLEWLLSRFTGYAGVINEQGDKFLSAEQDLTPILKAVRSRGLYFLDRGTTKLSVLSRLAPQLKLVASTGAGYIDQRQSREDITRRLSEVEHIAREKGFAVGSGFHYPVTIEIVKEWCATLEEKGLVLAPVSAIMPPIKSERPT